MSSTPHSLVGECFADLQNRLHKPAAHCRLLVFGLFFQTAALQAIQTENNVLPIVPARGAVKIDGQANDWGLSGGSFTEPAVIEGAARGASDAAG